MRSLCPNATSLWLWLAVVLALLGVLCVALAAHSHSYFDALTGVGGFVAGIWALAAASVTVYGLRKVADDAQATRRREIAAVCLAELQALWRRLEENHTIYNIQTGVRRLQDQRLRQDGMQIVSGQQPPLLATYRGHLGWDWLPLQPSRPEVFGVLPFPLASGLTDYYSRLRHICGRLNWMNDQKFTVLQIGEVIQREGEVCAELEKLRAAFGTFERQLREISGVPFNGMPA